MPRKGSAEHLAWLQAALTRFERPLLRYAVRLTGDNERAREVVQDTFLKLWEADPDALDEGLASWLFTVCRNRAFDTRKKERRMKPFNKATDVEAVAEEGAGLMGRYESRQESSEILRALAHLSPNQREVVRLKFQNDLSYKEIAAITGLSVSNVGFLLHTALKELRKHVASQDSEAGGVQ